MKTVLAVLLVLAFPVSAHEPGMASNAPFWADKYFNKYGSRCCGVGDMAFISHRVANAAQLGSRIVAAFPDGAKEVVVGRIYPTEDRMGRAAITKSGCLFKHIGF